MKLVIQRALEARVETEGRVCGQIEKGLVIFVGVTHADTEEDAACLAKKVASLRIFEDAEGKMNLSIKEVGGAILSVSQFTLYADARKGNRPGFAHAARPEQARPLYACFNGLLEREYGLDVQTGVFGADMKVRLVNDGPVTILLDSRALKS